jgi:ligand-binding sensor domain-containing protein
MKQKRNIILGAFAVLLVLCQSCKKDEPVTSFPDQTSLDVELFTVSNSGLHENAITSLESMPNGEIWVGTDEGIAVFNGSSWSVLDTSNGNLPSVKVNDIAILSNGEVFVATDAGIGHYNGSTWGHITNQNSPLLVNKVRSLDVDDNDKLWIGTFSGGGLMSYDGSSWEEYTPANSGLPNNSVSSVCCVGNDVWVATAGGLTLFSSATWTTYTKQNSGLPNNNVYSIADDGDRLLVGTDGGLAIYETDMDQWEVYDASNTPMTTSLVRPVCLANQGKVWVGTISDGLLGYDGSSWDLFSSDNSDLIENNISALVVHNGFIWGGTSSSGVFRIEL